MKKQILELRKGKRKRSINLWQSYEGMQGKLAKNEYLLFWRVNAKEVVYIDSDHILTGYMTERTFDTIDTLSDYGTI